MFAELSTFIAQATEAVDFGLLDYVNLGVLAFLAIAFIRGWVVPGYILDREQEILKEERERYDKLHNETQDLRQRIDDKVLPALWEVTSKLAEFVQITRDKDSES